MLKKLQEKFVKPVPVPEPSTEKVKDVAVAAVLISAILGVLVLVGYIVTLLIKDRNHQKKWEDYDDCGWA